MEISLFIDHTLLKAGATNQEIEQLCQEAMEYKFAAVCVNPNYVQLCNELLTESDVKVCTVIGFPLGANKTEVKVFEAEQAIQDGAEEIDYVVNISDVKNDDFEAVKVEMQKILEVKKDFPALLVKIILEVCYLTDLEIGKISKIAKECGIDFVKTSTGFGNGGATEEAVKIMSEMAGEHVKVKASGGVRTLTDAKNYISLGVSRIGTSNGISIVKGEVASTISY